MLKKVCFSLILMILLLPLTFSQSQLSYATLEGIITHRDKLPIEGAKVLIASFNPCYSGAVVDDISRKGVIVITSVNANQTNRFGWAGEWRNALLGGTSDNRTDRNGDGFISMTEAYEWVAVKSQAYNPIVITSAQINGKAISSCAVNLAKDNFLLYLTDDQGRAVPNAWVQWIAFVPSPTQEVIGGVLIASHGQHISFPRLSSTPVIVTNAQKDGKALISGAQNNAPDGFDLCILDDSGRTVSGAWVLWIVVVPNSKNGFKGEVRMRSNGQNIQFTPSFSKGPVYVLSAQPGVMVGAVDNRQDGFTLSLIKHDGTRADNIM